MPHEVYKLHSIEAIPRIQSAEIGVPLTRLRSASEALAGILGFALALRLFLLLTHTYIVHPDETFQYLEQAHRLAFGYGVSPGNITTAFAPWLFPGVLAGLMRLVAGFNSSPRRTCLSSVPAAS